MIARPVNAGPQELIQQEIAVGRRRLGATQDQMAFQPEAGRGGGGLPAMVGLDGAGGNEGIRALRQRLADKIFEFAGLVAPEGQARQIVTLDKDP